MEIGMRYKQHGWFNESYRHSLAAKGIKTSFAPANWKKGMPVEEMEWDPEKGRMISTKHRLSALGVKYGNKRDVLKFSVLNNADLDYLSRKRMSQLQTPQEESLVGMVPMATEEAPIENPFPQINIPAVSEKKPMDAQPVEAGQVSAPLLNPEEEEYFTPAESDIASSTNGEIPVSEIPGD